MADTAPAFAPQVDRSSSAPSGYEAASVVRHLTHELRQPLSTVESIAYYLQMVTPRQDLKTQHQLEKLQQLVEQMNWILSDAVHFLQAAPAVPQLLDLNELLSEALAENAGSIPSLDLNMAQGALLVCMDPIQARHMLRSLCQLFVHLGHGCQSIPVRAWPAEGEAWLEMRVPGMEMSIEALEQMFEPFSPHLPAGSGLALASVRRIVQTAGGRLDSHSDPLRGTWIAVSFPLA
ncbi:MAG: HAMP domain-containing histidine kinase [Acidobacteriia bacterium]|nr:HAMP domain-containing histidine kinase [Terriglobia bacterium]